MSHDQYFDAPGGGYRPQTFKTNKTNWLDGFNAYNSDEMQKVSTYFANVLSAMEDANEAIENSGIEGISKINLAFDYSDIAEVEDKRENLSDFSAGVYDDAEKLIEDPFHVRIYELMRSTQEHKTMPVTYMGNTIEIPFEHSFPQSIFAWMMYSVENTDIDDLLYTGDERKDEIIREYMTYDMRTGTYGFEGALENWDNLNPYRQVILAHCYEYSYRQYEMVMDENSYGAKEKHDIVQRMANKFIEHKDSGKYVEVSSAGKGMSSYLDENSRGKKFVDDLNSKKLITGDFNIEVSHEGAATVFRMTGDGKAVNTYGTSYAFCLSLDDTLSYCVSSERSIAYVFHEAEKNPGLYAHQKELGLSLYGVADILTAAENQTDMEILEKLSRNTGDYYSVFNKNADYLSDSANDKILDYVIAIQNGYRETGSFAYEREMAAIDSFYGDSDNIYSQGYFSRYFDLAKEHMTQEELVDLWVTPGYKMTEAELERAKIIARDELDKFEYGTAHDPNLETIEEQERYAKYLSLMNKCSKFACNATGILKPFASISDFTADVAEEIVGSKAETVAGAFDKIAGTDTLSEVLKMREDYAELSDKFITSVKNAEMNAETQNPKAYNRGKFVGNMLLYTATSPIFKGMATAIGVKSGLGLFFANQAAQNVQDLILDTRNVYNDLIADGELSDADKTVLKWNVGINGIMNGVFGLGDLYKLYKGAKVAKETGKEVIEELSKDGIDDGVEDIIKDAGEKDLTDETKNSLKRPTWRQSEIDARNDFPDYAEQVSFLNGEKVPYGTKGSVRPDFYKTGSSIDVKNYDLVTSNGRNRLINNISRQYEQRILNLPKNTKQSVLIDIRGQIIEQNNLDALYDDIIKKIEGDIVIYFKTE
ncbi:hypothetical protein [Butyrivibrio hungatei]|uniref:Uncharacterized protein n=1 Tax=Butyrivibrio hungatei TaxID=185008 RepID=A0A1D9P349_9FIRM|nr:hypothetical protein [Butyrivibrio hungatei]AOZ96931.1 hypothetical protein bhn_I1898 [Butyrivibrio hungatei]